MRIQASDTHSFFWVLFVCIASLSLSPCMATAKPTTQAAARAIPKPESLLPVESQIVLSMSSAHSFHQTFSTTPLHRLLKESEMQPVIKHVTRHLLRPYFRTHSSKRKRKSRWQRIQQSFLELTSLRLEEAFSLFSGPHALAVVTIPKGSIPLELGVVAGVSNTKKAHSLVSKILRHLPLPKNEYPLAGVRVQRVKGLKNELHYTLVGSQFLFATTRSLMAKMLARRKGRGKSILQDPAYRSFRNKMDASAGASIFLAADRLLQTLTSQSGRRRKHILHLLGLQQWKSIAFSLGIQKQRFTTRLHLAFKQKNTLRSINRLLALPDANEQLLQHLPRHTALAALFRIPWGKIYDDIVEALPIAGRRRLQRFQRFERSILRTSLRTRIAAFGENTAGFLFGFAGGGLLPQYAQVWQLQNARLVQKTLTQFVHLLSIQRTQAVYRGVSWSSIQIPPAIYRIFHFLPRRLRSLAYRIVGSPIRPCFAFVGNKLYLTFSARTLKNFIDASLSKRKQLATLRRALIHQAKGAGAWFYADTRRSFAMLYNTFLTAAPLAAGKRFGLRKERVRALLRSLPRSQIVVRHMTPGKLTNHTSPFGSLWSLQTGLGLEVAAITGAWLKAAEQLSYQYRLHSYLQNISSYGRLKQQSPRWKIKGHYTVAIQQWRQLAQRGVFHAIVTIAKKQWREFQQRHKQRMQAIQKQLSRLYHKQTHALSTWKLAGDWSLKKGVLQVLPHPKSNAQIMFGASNLNTYTLSFKVKNPSKGFKVGLHQSSWQQGKRSRTRSLFGRASRRKRDQRFRAYPFRTKLRYRARLDYKPHSSWISFAPGHFQEDTWTPIKIKVKGKQIWYRLGLKKYKFQTSRSLGKIILQVPTGGRFELQGLSLKAQGLKLSRKAPPYPSLQVQLVATHNTVSVGTQTGFRLHLKNVGQKPARKLKIQFQLSQHLKFASARGTDSLWSPRKRTLTFATVPSLKPQKSLSLLILADANMVGSGAATAYLRFFRMNGEISVNSRVNIAKKHQNPSPSPTKADLQKKPSQGTLSRFAIRRVIRSQMRSLRHCYERQLLRNSKLKGSMIIRFKIAPGGRVVRVQIKKNTLRNSSVLSCIRYRFLLMRFPKPKGGSAVVNYPLNFHPGL